MKPRHDSNRFLAIGLWLVLVALIASEVLT
jgi:hypothetical protein